MFASVLLPTVPWLLAQYFNLVNCREARIEKVKGEKRQRRKNLKLGGDEEEHEQGRFLPFF